MSHSVRKSKRGLLKLFASKTSSKPKGPESVMSSSYPNATMHLLPATDPSKGRPRYASHSSVIPQHNTRLATSQLDSDQAGQPYSCPGGYAPSSTMTDLDDYIMRTLNVLLEKNLEQKVREIVGDLLHGAARQVQLPAAADERKGSFTGADQYHGDRRSAHSGVDLKNQDLQRRLDSKQRQLEECLEKQRRLEEEVEEVKSQQSVSNSGSYEEGAPAPPMLRACLDAVKNALVTCASMLASECKKQMKADQQSTKLNNLPPYGGGLPPISAYDFQLQLCETFFQDFESLSFEAPPLHVNGTAPVITHFERPIERKRRLFKEYEQYKAINEHTLYDDRDPQKPNFRHFLIYKLHMFLTRKDPAPFAAAAQRESCLRSILQDPATTKASRRISVFLEFAALGKAVWLLHKLVLAFQPTAEIFRVPSGSPFDPKYMLDMEPDGEDAAGPATAHVRFMAVPGFTVRNLTFQAQVYLKKPV